MADRNGNQVFDRYFVAVILVVQAGCAVFFVSDIMLTLIGFRTRPVSWQTRELLEIGAAIGLLLGLVLGALALRRTMVRRREAEERLRVASGAFMELLEERFETWALTPAERDVALFSIKGLSLQDIARLRSTSEGTVKAQTNAIYRKAGVSGRSQLLSLFIEDLMGDGIVTASIPGGTATPAEPPGTVEASAGRATAQPSDGASSA